jgi:hypothetical protein
LRVEGGAGQIAGDPICATSSSESYTNTAGGKRHKADPWEVKNEKGLEIRERGRIGGRGFLFQPGALRLLPTRSPLLGGKDEQCRRLDLAGSPNSSQIR